MSRSSTSSSDGLITESSPARTRTLVVSAIFCCVCGGTGLIDLVSPTHVRVAGLEAEAEARRWEQARFWDGTLARQLDRSLRKRSTVRRAVLPPWTAALWGALDETRDDVVSGEDGYLFRDGLRGWRSEVRGDVRGAPPRVVSYVARRLRARGVRLVVFPVPSKAAMHSDLMRPAERPPLGAYEAWMNDLDALGVEAVDVAAVFAAHPDEQLYSRTDTHWSNAGARWAAEAAVRAAGVLVPESARTTVVRSSGLAIDAGNILDWMGIDSSDVRAGGATGSILDALGCLHTIEAFDVRDRDTGASATGLARNPGAPVVLVGTSFTGAAGFFRFVGHYSERQIYAVALPGGGPGGALEEVLRRAADADLERWPDVVVWEFQAHSPQVTPFHFLDLARLAGLLPGGGFEPLPGVVLERTGRLIDGSHELTERGVSGRLRWDQLAQPGDGRVGLRLVGRADGPIVVQIGFRGVHPPLRVRWMPDRDAITIPILWGDVTGLSVRLLSETPVSVRLESMELVWDLDTGRAVTVDVGVPEGTGDGWRCEATLPAGVLSVAGASILMRDAEDASLDGVEAVLLADGAIVKRWAMGPVASGTRLLAPPRVDAGAAMTLELRGEGPAPPRVSTSITVVPQQRGG
ncbi:MAG: hypothetical protein CMJ90_04850 [Planctomycetes bacterium]|nr:hypothetical protein [Planctomycetota bacterium]